MEQMENGKFFDQMSGKPLIFYSPFKKKSEIQKSRHNGWGNWYPLAEKFPKNKSLLQ